MPKLITPLISDQKAYSEKAVCEYFNIDESIIKDSVRSSINSHARMAVWYILQIKFRMSYTLIGQIYSRHPSTIIHGVQSMSKYGDNLLIWLGKSRGYPVDNMWKITPAKKPFKLIPTVVPSLSTGRDLKKVAINKVKNKIST